MVAVMFCFDNISQVTGCISFRRLGMFLGVSPAETELNKKISSHDG